VARDGNRPLVSVVVPVLDEEAVLEELHRRLAALAEGGGARTEFEFIFVDDGSTDRSRRVLAGLASRDERTRAVCLTRNFGQEAASAAGLDHASGDAVVFMDADLQDPPELIGELVDEWLEGHDVVHARRLSRPGDPLLKRAAAFAFYRFMGVCSDARLVGNTGAFRLVDRRVVDGLCTARQRSRFLRGLLCWAGGRQAVVTFHRDCRHAGRTKYGLGRQLALALDAVTGFSPLPLRLVGGCGSLLASAGIASILTAVVLHLASSVGGLSWWILGGGLALCTGLVLTSLWVVGEYVYRLGHEVRGLPLYVVRDRLGFGDRKEVCSSGRC
jgi:dolichol-phosphate mannosyltransferase